MDDKVRVFEIAEEAGSTSAEVIKKAADLAIVLKSPQSTVSFEEAEEIAEYIMTGNSKLLKAKKEKKTVETTKQQKSEKVETSVSKDVEKKEKTPQKEEKKKVSETKKELPKRKELKIVQKKNIEPETKEVVEEEETIEAPLEKSEEVFVAVQEEITQEKEVQEPLPSATQPQEVQPVAEKSKDKVVLKKRGLTIVKKKKPIISHEPAQPQSKKQKMASMSELFGAGADLKEEYTPKVKKSKPKTAAKAHEHGKKLAVETQREQFKEPDESLVGEEVVLLDMDLMETSKFLQETPKPKNIRTTKPSAFGNQPRGLKRGKKKKKYKKPVEEIEITEVTIPEECRVYEFAEKIGKTAGDVIGKLFMLGMMVTKNDFLGNDEIEILGEEYGIDITIKDEKR